MISLSRSLTCFLVLTFSIWLFNACSGAASKRAEILRSINSNLEIAPSVSEKEAEKAIEESATGEEEAKPDDPTEFNYFPYDLQLDTIAYMSCENTNYFSFKAGAYFERSGLRLSEYFLKKISSMSQSALKALIESSTKHQAIPYLSIAHTDNLIHTPKAVQFPLRLPRFIEDLISTGNSRLRAPSGEPIEKEISFGSNAGAYASSLNKKWRLVLSYKGGKEGKTLHQTDGDWGVDIYGRVYNLHFNEILSASLLSRYVLDSVSEEKKPQAPPQTDWVCPESLRFEIRRHAENAYKAQKCYDTLPANYKKQYPTLAAALNAEDPASRLPPDEPICVSSSNRGTPFTVARTVLGEEWNVNTNKQCISLKSPGGYCYIITEKQKPCSRLVKSNADCSRNGGHYCPHFLSVCVRKN